MARPLGRKALHPHTEGAADPQMPNGYLNRTKRLVDAAYEVWRLKNGIPKYDHWGHIIS
jgi:hypothetical protein